MMLTISAAVGADYTLETASARGYVGESNVPFSVTEEDGAGWSKLTVWFGPANARVWVVLVTG